MSIYIHLCSHDSRSAITLQVADRVNNVFILCEYCSVVYECDISVPGILGISATYMYISYRNGAMAVPWGTPARICFHSENFPSTVTLNLRSVRYDASRTRLESVFPLYVACK